MHHNLAFIMKCLDGWPHFLRVHSCPYLHFFFLFSRSVASSSLISPARSASLWTLISSATPVIWAECAPHTIFPLTTHTERRLCSCVCVQKEKLVLTCCRSRAFSFFFALQKMKLLILRHFHWFFDLDQSPLSHVLPAVLLLYHSNKGTGKKLLLFCFFTPMWLLFAVEEQGIFFFFAKTVFVHIIASKHFALKFNFTVRFVTWICKILGKNITVISVVINIFICVQTTVCWQALGLTFLTRSSLNGRALAEKWQNDKRKKLVTNLNFYFF